MGITNNGEPAICKTKGNKDCHIILRGGSNGPNYKSKFIKNTEQILIDNNIKQNIMVDCSHGNSKKIHTNQKFVLKDVITQINDGNKSIIGVMIESNIKEGNQKLSNKQDLKVGISITDACIGLDETEDILMDAYLKL